MLAEKEWQTRKSSLFYIPYVAYRSSRVIWDLPTVLYVIRAIA